MTRPAPLHRIRTLRAFLVALVVLATPAQARNYLIVIADDLGVDKVSGYTADYPGYIGSWIPDTPAIDSLGDAGLRFSRVWASPGCSPTRVSMQTGVYPFEHGIGSPLQDDVAGVDPLAHDMLGTALLAGGYATAWYGKWHLGTEDETGAPGVPMSSPYFADPHPSRAGFHHFHGALNGALDYTSWTHVSWTFNVGEVVAGETDHPTPWTADQASAWINAQANPWVAFVSFNAPHAGNGGWSTDDVDPACTRSANLACLGTDTCTDVPRAVYQALAECVDIELEGLLNSIPAATLDDTLIVFLGDNGTPSEVQENDFAVAGRGKLSVYENGLRVPFLVADGATWRTGAAGAISSPGRKVIAEIETIDLYETLHLDATGVSSGSTRSRSFLPCFTNTTATCGLVGGDGYSEQFGGAVDRAAVREGYDKMIVQYDAVRGCLVQTFYDTRADPLERTPTTFSALRTDALEKHFMELHDGTMSWGDEDFCL